MVKSKIAVFINGYCAGIVTQFFDGFRKAMGNQKVDVYCFCAYPASELSRSESMAELNIYNLPDLEDFDMAIIIDNGIDYNDIFDVLHEKCLKANIPFVTTVHRTEKGSSVICDNAVGAYELVSYCIDELGCKDIAFLAGSENNPDSQLRLQIVKEAMKERGLVFSEDETRLCYTGWRLQGAADFAHIITEKDLVPDVIICANDELAMALCYELANLGVDVPGDVKITGFDDSYFSKIFNPCITTVDQNFIKAGAECAKLLLDVINGCYVKSECVVDSKLIRRESTGEASDKEVDLIRKNVGNETFSRRIIEAALSRKIAGLEKDILSADSLEQVHNNMISSYAIFKLYERKRDFHIILDARYVESLHEMSAEFKSFEYSDELYVLYSREDGEEYDSFMMPRKQLIPHISESDDNRFFLFSPLHEDGKTLGYMIQSDGLDIINEKNDLRRYEEAVSVCFSRLIQRIQLSRLNNKLLDLSHTDSLTSVRNRNAYEEKVRDFDFMIRTNPDFVRFSLAVFDLNGLKIINDSYGHEKGDDYIIDACAILCRAFEHSLVYRIGGDEFVVLLCEEDDKRKYDIINQLYLDIDKRNEADIEAFKKISFAGGVAEFDATKDKCFSDVFNRADSVMYEKKLAMKKNSLSFT